MARKSRKPGSSYGYFKQLFHDHPEWLKESRFRNLVMWAALRKNAVYRAHVILVGRVWRVSAQRFARPP